MNDLCDFEYGVLEAMTGKRTPLPWGAAVGAALECLRKDGMISLLGGVYTPTEKGLAALAKREFDRISPDDWYAALAATLAERSPA
jgi:hypothetical protein